MADIKAQNFSAQRGRIGELDVTRMRVGTGDKVNADSDLMKEVLSAVKHETSTLDKSLKLIHKTLESMRKETGKKSGSGRSGRRDIFEELMGVPKGAPSGAKKFAGHKEFQDLTHAITELKKTLSGRGGGSGSAMPSMAAGMMGGMGGYRYAGRSDEWHDKIRRKKYTSVTDLSMKSMEDFRKGLKSIGKDAHESFTTGMIKPFKGMNEAFFSKIERLGAELASFAGVVKDIKDRFQEYMKDVGGSGTMGSGQYIADDLERAAQGRLFSSESYRNTFKFVQRNLKDDVLSPLAQTGKTIEQLGDSLYKARGSTALGGMNIYGRQGFQEFEDTMYSMYDFQKKVGIKDDHNFTVTLKNTAEQLNYLRLTASNTGYTVDQLVKMGESLRKDVSVQTASGLLGQKEGTNYAKYAPGLQAMGPAGRTAVDMMNKMNVAGSFSGAIADNPSMAWLQSVSGGPELMQKLNGILQRGPKPGQSTADFQREQFAILHQISGRTRAMVGTHGDNAGVLGRQYKEFPGAMEMVAGLAQGDNVNLRQGAEAGAAYNDPMFSMVNRMEDIMSNNGKELLELGASLLALWGSSKIMNLMLGANTVATAANTMAMFGGGGGLGGLMGGLGGGLMRGGLIGAGVIGGGMGLYDSVTNSGRGSLAAYAEGGVSGAAMGAAIGSIFPGVGTLIGAGVGGAVGLGATALSRNFFQGGGDASSPDSASPATAASGFGERSDAIVKTTLQWQDDTRQLLAAILVELKDQSDALDSIDEHTDTSAEHLEEIRKRRADLTGNRTQVGVPQNQSRPNTTGYDTTMQP